MNDPNRWMAMALMLAIASFAHPQFSVAASATSDADEIVTWGEPSPRAARAPSASRSYSQAQPAEPRSIGRRPNSFRFPVGLSFISGMIDLQDYAEERTNLDVFGVPIGLGFAPYYQFAHGSRIGIDLGPAQIVLIDSSVEYWGVPLAVTYGFAFMPRSSFSPYARIGFKYPIAGGDWVESSSPGLFGAVGLEFLRTRIVGINFEVGYDGSEVEMETRETIRPGQVLVSIRAIF